MLFSDSISRSLWHISLFANVPNISLSVVFSKQIIQYYLKIMYFVIINRRKKRSFRSQILFTKNQSLIYH